MAYTLLEPPAIDVYLVLVLNSADNLDSSTVVLRAAKQTDLVHILDLFEQTIRRTCAGDYTPDQIEAWASGRNNQVKWEHRIKSQYFLLATMDNRIVGFASLENDNYIDLLYVHNIFLERGIATMLYQALEDEATQRGVVELSSDVSITARPFFERQGFAIQLQNQISVRDVELVNFRMTKSLTPTI